MTRQHSPVSPPVVLSIAGSDSGGGAGLQADTKTSEAGGAFATTAITSVTAQNTTGVQDSHHLPIEQIQAQMEAVLEDFAVDAVKTGMLATTPVVEAVVDAADRLPNLVVDPVMVAATGDRLLEREAESAYEALIAEATLVTPNAEEAAVLTDIEVTDVDSARQAGKALLDMGAEAAVLKGGHVPGETVRDVLVTRGDGGAETATESFEHPRVDTEGTHGSGCTLSSAIATRLAHGDSLSVAVESGIDLLARAVRYNIDVGEGPGSVHHSVAQRDRAARDSTAEAVDSVVAACVREDLRALVDEDGMAVVGATPYADSDGDVAAVEGRIDRVRSGVRPNRGVRFGIGGRPADLLLDAREVRPDLGFAAACRYDSVVATALEDCPWPRVSLGHESDLARVEEAFSEDATTEPPVLLDRRQDDTVVFASDAATLTDRLRTLCSAVESLARSRD